MARMTRSKAQKKSTRITDPDVREITHGNQNLYFYSIDSSGSYGSAIKQLGMRAFSKEISQEISNTYADNRIHMQGLGTVSISGEVTVLQIAPDVSTNYLGYRQNANGSFTDGNKSALKSFGMAYAELVTTSQGDTFRVHCLYDNKATQPSQESTTDEEGIEAKEYVVPFSGKVSDFVADDLGNKVSYMYFDMPLGSTEDDVITLLETGMPMPTDALPSMTPATGSISIGTPTDTEIPFDYDFTVNDGNISSSKIEISEASTPSIIVDEILPLIEGTATPGSFTGLTTSTAYIIKMYCDGQEINSSNATTL